MKNDKKIRAVLLLMVVIFSFGLGVYSIASPLTGGAADTRNDCPSCSASNPAPLPPCESNPVACISP